MSLPDNTFRDALLRNDLRDFQNLFLDQRHRPVDSLFGSTFRNALLRNDLRDFRNLFLDLRHGYIVSLFDNTFRDALLRNDLRDFQNLFLDQRHRHVEGLDEFTLRDVLLWDGLDHTKVFPSRGTERSSIFSTMCSEPSSGGVTLTTSRYSSASKMHQMRS